MGFRTILIAAGITIASTLGLAQRTSAPPATTTSTSATTTGAATTGVNSTTPIPAPGESNVPLGINAVGVGSGTATTPVPTAIVVPTNATGFVGPSQSFPLVTTPTITFVNSADGTTTVPVVSYGSGSAMPNSSAPAGNAVAANTGSAQVIDLNLGSVGSVAELYGDNRSVAEVARLYKTRKNGVQNARVYTNADIARIRQQGGEGTSSVPANDRGAMPASDQSAEQNNQATTPQVQQPAANQKPSPFSPKK
jgi:hypothetical protein